MWFHPSYSKLIYVEQRDSSNCEKIQTHAHTYLCRCRFPTAGAASQTNRRAQKETNRPAKEREAADQIMLALDTRSVAGQLHLLFLRGNENRYQHRKRYLYIVCHPDTRTSITSPATKNRHKYRGARAVLQLSSTTPIILILFMARTTTA